MFSCIYKVIFMVAAVVAASEKEFSQTSSISDSENRHKNATYNYIAANTGNLPRCYGHDSLRQNDEEDEKTLDSSLHFNCDPPSTLFKPFWEDLLYFKNTHPYLGGFLRDLKLFCEKEGLLFRNLDHDYKKFTSLEKMYDTKLKIYELFSQTENYFCSSVDSEKIIQEHVSVLNGIKIIVADTTRFITSRKREDWTDSLKPLENTIMIVEKLANFYDHHAEKTNHLEKQGYGKACKDIAEALSLAEMLIFAVN